MKLLATADLHIRKQEDTAVLARILQAAKEFHAEALLIGGDLLDRPFLESAVEDAVRERGAEMKDLPLEELTALWEQAKRA